MGYRSISRNCPRDWGIWALVETGRILGASGDERGGSAFEYRSSIGIKLQIGDTMQSPLFEPSNLPELEQPGAIEQALFVEPLVGMVGVFLVGVLLMLALRARGKSSQGLIALGVAVVVCGGMYLVSEMVTTDREVLAGRARLLVGSVATGDETGMRSLMDTDVRVGTRFVSASGIDGVVSLASARVPGLVKSHKVPEVRADLPGQRVGRTMVKVRIEGAMAPGSSWWMVYWERDDTETDQWRATRIEPVWIQGVNDPAG